MTEDFQTEAFLYLVDQLDAAERAAFEQRLARDPAARAALAACRADVARFALDSAPAEALAPAVQRATLSAILSTMAASPARRPPGARWKRLVWPLAAALLLALNLLQFFRPAPPQAGPLKTLSRPAPGPGTPAGSAADEAASPNIAEEMRLLEQLRAEYADLERARNALRSEQDVLLRQRARMDKRIGRLAAMELVDPGSYARGARNGLVNIARGLLTEPGIVASVPGALSPAEQPANSASIPPGSTPAAQPPPSNQPYAWSVFDETEARGYLNFYNLPPTPPNQTLQLWVKPAGSTVYQNAGTVPPPAADGSGTVIYNLPKSSPPPTEVLVTQEPANAVPPQPTLATAVVHGP